MRIGYTLMTEQAGPRDPVRAEGGRRGEHRVRTRSVVLAGVPSAGGVTA